MIATFDGLALAGATILASVIAVGVPVVLQVRSNRKTRERLGEPNGGGSLVGEVQIVQSDLGDVKRQVGTIATTATAALAVSEASSMEVRRLNAKLNQHLEIHGCPPLED